MLAHAGMSGGPDYLSDGVTQLDFLHQFYFQLAAGILAFAGSRFVIQKLKRGSIRRRTWIYAGAIPVVLLAAGLAYGGWQKAKEGPRVNGKTIAQWIAAASPVENDRDPAVLALKEAGAAALPYLMNALRTGKAEFHWFGSYSAPRPDQIQGNAAQVLKSLRNHAAPLVPALVECLNSGELELRQLAAEILGTTGVSNEGVRRGLLHALSDSEVAYHASNALGALGWNDTNIVHDLATAAKSATPTKSYWAVVGIRYLTTNALPALPVLIDFAKNGDGQTRQAAIEAIALIGPDAPAANSALPQLERLIKRADTSTRLDIARALWRIESNRVTNALPVARSVVNRMLRDGVDSMTLSDSHRSALLLLGEMGAAARPAVPALLECLQSPAPLVRFSAAWAICQAAPDEKDLAVQTLEKLAAAKATAAPAETLSQALNEFREYKARYPAQLAAAGACWRLQPDRRSEWRLAIVELLKEWTGWLDVSGSVAEQKVLIPVLEDILADSSAREIHPLAQTVLWRIRGPAGEWW
jgi:HEAT repeat protein